MDISDTFSQVDGSLVHFILFYTSSIPNCRRACSFCHYRIVYCLYRILHCSFWICIYAGHFVSEGCLMPRRCSVHMQRQEAIAHGNSKCPVNYPPWCGTVWHHSTRVADGREDKIAWIAADFHAKKITPSLFLSFLLQFQRQRRSDCLKIGSQLL